MFWLWRKVEIGQSRPVKESLSTCCPTTINMTVYQQIYIYIYIYAWRLWLSRLKSWIILYEYCWIKAKAYFPCRLFSEKRDLFSFLERTIIWKRKQHKEVWWSLIEVLSNESNVFSRKLLICEIVVKDLRFNRWKQVERGIKLSMDFQVSQPTETVIDSWTSQCCGSKWHFVGTGCIICVKIMPLFIGTLCTLVLLCFGVQWHTRSKSSGDSSKEFKQFQRTYIVVYLMATGKYIYHARIYN